ncbi:acyltransferase [Pseudoroseomonas sp. WGS1072]|uniref:acyltransferase n=1 Tax=Roseomonas sp. WGS1072 TaxID=3366816 RepID=UPI003BF13222
MSVWVAAKRRLFVRGPVRIGRDFHLGALSWISASLSLDIGDDVYVGKMCTIQCNGRIGSGVLIANQVGIVGRMDHDFRQIGTNIRRARWIGADLSLQTDSRNAVDIRDDVWVGYGAIILSGVVIGRGAIISAGAVVRSDVAAYDIVAGNPAAPVGRRFAPQQIIEHEAMLRKRGRTAQNA